MQEMTNTESAVWNKFEIGLKQLNRNQVTIENRFSELSHAVDFALENGIAGPSQGYLANMKERGERLKSAIAALNNAHNLTQTKSAFVSASRDYPGDLDILADPKLPQSTIDASTFDRDLLPIYQELGIWPLVVKGAILLGMALIVNGIVDAVTETIESQNKYNQEIQRAQTDAETTFSKDPSIFKLWTKYKQAITGIKPGMFESIGKGLGGTAGIALALLVGYFIFQSVRGKSK